MVNALGQLSMALPHAPMLQHAPMLGSRMAPHPFIGPVGPQHLRPRMYGGGGGHFLMHMLAMHGMGPR
jgi:hypothetical protein